MVAGFGRQFVKRSWGESLWLGRESDAGERDFILAGWLAAVDGGNQWFFLFDVSWRITNVFVSDSTSRQHSFLLSRSLFALFL